MGYKEDFLTSLNAEMSEALLTLVEAVIPEAPTIATPATVDDAIIASGVLSTFLLDCFRPFAGLPVIELLLRIGQKNATLQAALLAGLEYVKKDSFDFTILSPTSEGIYLPEDEIQFSVEMEQEAFKVCTGITVEIPELGQTITLEREFEVNAYIKNTALNYPDVQEFPLDLTARFMPTFEDTEPYNKTVLFTVSAPV